MIKYIYYRLCKHHEKGKRINISTKASYNFISLVYFMMSLPLAMILIKLVTLISRDELSYPFIVIVFIFLIVLNNHQCDRFEKTMETYKPPKRYKSLKHISPYWFFVPLCGLIFPLYFFLVIVLIWKIIPSYLEGLMAL